MHITLSPTDAVFRANYVILAECLTYSIRQNYVLIKCTMRKRKCYGQCLMQINNVAIPHSYNSRHTKHSADKFLMYNRLQFLIKRQPIISYRFQTLS